MSAPYPPVDGTEMCARTDPEAWFPTVGVRPYMARRLCQGCHVQTECLEFALWARAGLDFVRGVWGGTSYEDRQKIRAEMEQAA